MKAAREEMLHIQRHNGEKMKCGKIHMIIGLMKGLLLITTNTKRWCGVNYLIVRIVCRQNKQAGADEYVTTHETRGNLKFIFKKTGSLLTFVTDCEVQFSLQETGC